MQKLRNMMKDGNLKQVLVTASSSIFYFTGTLVHPGERLLVLLVKQEGKPVLFINELFPVKEQDDLDYVWIKDTSDSIGILSDYLDPLEKIGIDKAWPAGFLIALMERMGTHDVVNASLLVDRIRSRKSEEEIQLMREVSILNDKAMGMLIERIDENLTEKEMERLLLTIYEEIGTDGFSFDPIIAYGENGADPHHENGNRKLKEGDSIIIDIGCRKDSYCADMTRTVFYKSVPERSWEVYNTVLEANLAAFRTVRPGVRFSDIDHAARSYIEDKGYGKYFTHRTGHSIGIEVHEFGDVSASNENLLEPGMIFSIEPGIYLEGEVGVRIEDLVLVTEDGAESLNQYPKDLIVVG